MLKWEPGYRYHSMQRANYPYCLYLFRSRTAAIEFVRGSLAVKLVIVREPFGSHERGARVWAAFAIYFTHTTILELPLQR